MKKTLSLILACIITIMIISSCSKSNTAVHANPDNWKQVDNLGNHIFYVWTDEVTDKDYIIYHNTFYNEFSICPR